MMKVVLPDSEIRRFRKWTDKLSKENKEKVRRTVIKATEMMEKQSQHKAPVDHGILRRSIHSTYSADYLGSQVVVNAYYGPFVEFGTRRHPLTPRTKKVLAWKTIRGMAFSKGHMHPGTRPRPFFYPVFERVKKALISDLNKMGFK